MPIGATVRPAALDELAEHLLEHLSFEEERIEDTMRSMTAL